MAVKIEDAPARVDMLQGIAMRQLGRAEEARRCFVRASTKDPSDATPHLELASLALERGEAELARESLMVAHQLKRDAAGQDDSTESLQEDKARVASEPDLSGSEPQRR